MKKLFEELRDEEIQHQKLVLAELDKTPPDPALKAEGFEERARLAVAGLRVRCVR